MEPAHFGRGPAMSVGYRAISWNRQKRIYDSLIVCGIVSYLGLFFLVGSIVNPYATAETLLIRGFGTGAFLMLHVVLSIGPLCRLEPRLLPLLYNRRHLGVATFLMGLAHGGFAVFQFHALGNVNPLVSLLSSNTRFDSLANFPFQQLGLLALMILFLMAATSHDFWLKNLSAPAWKGLHMLVYAAYGLLVAHVTLGAWQSEHGLVLAVVPATGVAVVLGLHLAAAKKEHRIDAKEPETVTGGFVRICAVEEIPEKCARVVSIGGERVAAFKYDGKVSVISNVCRHQNGPLGEGMIVDGCVTCPWHGFQYLPETGASPPPFTEKVATYRVKIDGGQVLIDPAPLSPGTFVEPARIEVNAL